MGRNKYSYPDNIGSLETLYPALDINILTAHKSKGLEADIAVITGVSSGKVGFPSSREGDPILDLALAKQENFAYAEERRLFYVAVTRAKEEVHILASNTNVSSFARELEKDMYDVYHHYKDNIRSQICPKYKLGTLTIRTGPYGKLWGCSSYSNLDCDYTAKVYPCPLSSCMGILLLDKNNRTYSCNKDDCVHQEKACPNCRAKLQIKYNTRQNNRPFFGCTNFHTTGYRYTENV